ncbi:MAG: hypothetical protein J6A90_01040 [Clostridia bacterium]|nr:hypothetical protein [Clostridia bacterium]
MKKRALLLLLLILGALLLVCACGTGGTDTSTTTDTGAGDTSSDTGSGACKQHILAIDPAVPATCTESGLTEGKHCSACGQVFVKQSVIPKLGHKEITVDYKEPTCNSDGHTAGVMCERCGEAFEGAVTLPRLDHVEVTGEATEPTCKSEGATARVYCASCGKTLVASEKIPALPHTVVAIPKKEATCAEAGSTGGTRCLNCKTIIKAPTVIPALPHTEVENEYKAPTCDEPGYIGGTCCSVCNATIVKGEEIAPLGHKDVVALKGYAPTCSKTGLTDGTHCNICGKDPVPQQVLDKLSHNEIVTKGVAPTCQSVGYTEKRQCSVCHEITVSSVVIPKIDHTAVIDKAVAPNCSETGLTEGSHCADCGAVLVKQETVAKTQDHVFEEFATVTKAPTTSSSGTGTHKCTKCGKSISVSFPKLTAVKLTADDLYSVETDIFNPAYVNRWKLFDGNKKNSDLWTPGNDWFGNVGDVLTITLDKEMTVSKLVMFRTGNGTTATVRLKDAAGNVTYSANDYANGGDAYGGNSQEKQFFSGKSYKCYTIEIEITGLKWESALTYKVTELEITAAPNDTRIEHTHDFREFIEVGRVATCQVNGADVYECFCGARKEVETPKADHSFDFISEIMNVSCTVGGRVVYECECGEKKTETSEPMGHSFNKLVEYKTVPTVMEAGKATYKCIHCSLREDRSLSILPLEDINYLRVDSMADGKIVLKFNLYEELHDLEVRYSNKEITAQNFEGATLINPEISGEALVTLILNLQSSTTNPIYIGVRQCVGTNYGEIATVRVGGDGEVEIDYGKAQVYHGEVLNSFRAMFDNDVSTKLGTIFSNSGDTAELYGSLLRPIVDLEYKHYISRVRLFYADAGKTVTVRWSEAPVDFMAEDSAWDGVKTITTTSGWNEIEIGAQIRYFQIVFTDGEAPCEVEAYGFQCGEGDEIATYKTERPKLGDLIGMCGFVAIGGGNTPIDSVICTTVLREYHNFGWSYVASNYGAKANVFQSSGMGQFDDRYREYKAAGINVIPCIQWNLKNETISYKVDENGLPIYQNGALVRATFWERFNPNTYFVYADNVFGFSARYGRNSSAELLAIAKAHCKDTIESVGQGTIEWIEMGNEPEGSWNGIHNYLSAYMLAAATSAAYDGHCATIPVQGDTGYHLGGKNADPTMKLAMAGVSGVSNEYITALIHWMKANRADGSVAFDAFNVHHYMASNKEVAPGVWATVGISPEEAKMEEVLSQLIEIRDKYYPEKEVWITEFGWDTNQSYSTPTSSHAYGEYTGRQVQAMWLTRSYLIFSACGLDKADMYMCEDVGIEAEAAGKYGTCGVIAFEKNEKGETVEVKKDSYYYLYTLKNALGAYTFDSKVEAYDENVMIYRFTTEDGGEAYAVWCKTSDGTKHENYQLRINGETATVIEAVYGDIDGVKTEVIADEYSYVSVDVSENPIYVIVD